MKKLFLNIILIHTNIFNTIYSITFVLHVSFLIKNFYNSWSKWLQWSFSQWEFGLTRVCWELRLQLDLDWVPFELCKMTANILVYVCVHDMHVSVVVEVKTNEQKSKPSRSCLHEISLSASPFWAQAPFFWQIEMKCVNGVHWVAVGTPLRGVTVWPVTLSPGAQTIGGTSCCGSHCDSVEELFTGAWRLGSGRTRPYVSFTQFITAWPCRAADLCVFSGSQKRSAFITRSPLLQGLHTTLWTQWSLSAAPLTQEEAHDIVHSHADALLGWCKHGHQYNTKEQQHYSHNIILK